MLGALIGTLLGILSVIFMFVFPVLAFAVIVIFAVLIAAPEMIAYWLIMKILKIFAAFSVLTFAVALPILIVFTKEGKFSKERLEWLKTTKYGKAKNIFMRILQVVLKIAVVFSAVVAVTCILLLIFDPFTALFGL